MKPKREHGALVSHLNDKTRQVTCNGTQTLIPLKFDSDGELVNETTPPEKLVIKRLNLRELAFLKAWREAHWNLEGLKEKFGLEDKQLERFVQRLGCFRSEDAKVQALAEIPTPAWVTAKHVENVYDGGTLGDSEQKSLQELSKIVGAYKPTTNLNINANILQMPQLTPAQAEAARKFFDTIAIEGDHAA